MKTSAAKFLAAGAALTLALPYISRAADFEARDIGSFQVQNAGVPDEAAMPAVDSGLAFDLQDMGQRLPGANLSPDQLDAMLPAATLPAVKAATVRPAANPNVRSAAPSVASEENAMTPENSSGIAAWLDRQGLRGPAPAANPNVRSAAPSVAPKENAMTPENSSGIAAWLDRHHLRDGAGLVAAEKNILPQSAASVNFDGAASAEAASGDIEVSPLSDRGRERVQKVGLLMSQTMSIRNEYLPKIVTVGELASRLNYYGVTPEAQEFARIQGELARIDGEFKGYLDFLLTPLTASTNGGTAGTWQNRHFLPPDIDKVLAVKGLTLDNVAAQLGILESHLRDEVTQAQQWAQEVYAKYHRTDTVSSTFASIETTTKRHWYYLWLNPVHKVSKQKDVPIAPRQMNKYPFRSGNWITRVKNTRNATIRITHWRPTNVDENLDALRAFAKQPLPPQVIK
ncbi:MAG TPA: hypothetical protein VNH15_05505 [Elusimicrobiota bacterium]|nr:hypothetical protein [Elusimicrobiota bacterium]